MKAKDDSKVLLQVSVGDVLDNLAIHANFLELLAVLGQLKLIYQPVGNVASIPLSVGFEFGCMLR